MRILLLTLVFCLSTNLISAQQPAYQIYSSTIKLIALKGEENYQWENTVNTVFLDYKTGNIKIRLTNKDFYNVLHPAPENPDLELEELEYIFEGILPVTDIINQKSLNQKYDVELDLVCDDLRLYETVNFDMTITRPGSSSTNYRIFSLHGILYNDQLNLPLFEGFNNEIDLYINFNGFFLGN